MKIPHDQLKLYLLHNHFIIIHLQRRKNFSLEIIPIEKQREALDRKKSQKESGEEERIRATFLSMEGKEWLDERGLDERAEKR